MEFIKEGKISPGKAIKMFCDMSWVRWISLFFTHTNIHRKVY